MIKEPSAHGTARFFLLRWLQPLFPLRSSALLMRRAKDFSSV
jgi:hypothetical protein